jgi:thiosulfate dehydrogenase (quinone) large subunit
MATRSLDQNIIFTDPPIAQKLLNSTAWSVLWLVVRVYVGYQWLSSGWGKLFNPAWMTNGEALKGFWARAVVIPDAPARPVIAFDWYRAFIQGLLDGGVHVWFAKFVVIGEILIGIALILGLFTALAAFFGGFMNWNFMMAGTASTNPVLFTLSVLLILAWKTAGWWGLDRFILPMLGTPWQPGKVFKAKQQEA